MTAISLLILYYGILIIQVSSTAAVPENTELPTVVETNPFQPNGGMIGVSSVAEVTSKDGKVSTNGGVKFYSPAGTRLKYEDANFVKPWIFSKKTDDGFVMGAVQMYPNTVMASAVSYGQQNKFRPINPAMNWPIHNQIPNNFYTPTFTSPFHRNVPFPNYNMFQNFDPLFPGFGFQNAWYRPTRIYDPFLNIWR